MKIIDRLKNYILADGFHVVVDVQKSHDAWIVDQETGKEYLDCYSQFASQALGWNHKSLVESADYINKTCLHKLANPDMYCQVYSEFVETFASIAPDFKHFFFIDGGTLGVENALKAAFDWKCQLDPRHQRTDGQLLDVIHLREAFHGRSGYTLSLTNTGDIKTKWFPKFGWTRITNPKIHFPMQQHNVERLENMALDEMLPALQKGNVSAIILETIQGEGGDNYFRPEFLRIIRKLANEYEAMFILDEVQTGMGLTGKWWAYEHYDVKPDMIVFGKKSQVCGFCSTDRIELAQNHVFKQSGRINSTFGGNVTDMARAKVVIDIIKNEDLLEQTNRVGNYFLDHLKNITASDVDNIRGKGLMLAFDLPTPERRDYVISKMQENMLALKCGTRSIRFRPCLTFTEADVDMAIEFAKKALS